MAVHDGMPSATSTPHHSRRSGHQARLSVVRAALEAEDEVGSGLRVGMDGRVAPGSYVALCTVSAERPLAPLPYAIGVESGPGDVSGPPTVNSASMPRKACGVPAW